MNGFATDRLDRPCASFVVDQKTPNLPPCDGDTLCCHSEFEAKTAFGLDIPSIDIIIHEFPLAHIRSLGSRSAICRRPSTTIVLITYIANCKRYAFQIRVPGRTDPSMQCIRGEMSLPATRGRILHGTNTSLNPLPGLHQRGARERKRGAHSRSSGSRDRPREFRGRCVRRSRLQR